jgi:cation:H+ antiporter
MTTVPVAGSQSWRRPVAIASSAAALGLVTRAASSVLPAPVAVIGLAAGLVGAAFLLAWAADAGEVVFSGGLVLVLVALVAVLPEFVIEAHFAFTQQTQFVTANLTGASRLLLTAATAMPLLWVWLLARRGERATSIRLGTARRLDLGVLLIAALWAIRVAARGRLTLIDGVVLIGLYVLYVRRVQGSPDERPAVVGVAAGMAALPPSQRKRLITGLLVFAAIVVVAVANSFTEALLATGTSLGIDPYILVQSIVPVATETPEIVVVAVLALNHRPAQGLAVFLASSVSQLTLAMGSLPFVYLAGGGSGSIPLAGRERVELALTIATALMAVAALSSLAPERIDAWIVLTLFGIQFALPSTAVRIAVAVVLTMFALDLFASRRHTVRPMLVALRSPPPARGSPET